MKKDRKKIPSDVEEQIFFKSQMLCYCLQRGDQIHHIDGDRSNNDFDNLVFLCRPHHDDAEVRNGIGKGKINLARKIPTPRQIKSLRDKLYKDNDKKRRLEHANFLESLKKVEDENLFKAAMDAHVVVEILKLKQGYRVERDWEKRGEIVDKLGMFKDYKSPRSAYEVFELLNDLASMTRSGMTSQVAEAISDLVTYYFPDETDDKKIVAKLGERCTHIGWAIAYDAFIHLGNLATGSAGLRILSFIYRIGKDQEIPELCNKALHWYSEVQRTLVRPECGTDLEMAQKVTALFKENIGKVGYSEFDIEDRKLSDLILSHTLETRPKNKISRPN